MSWDAAEREERNFTRSKEALILYRKSHKTSLEILHIVLLFQKDAFKLRTCSGLAARMCAGRQNPSDQDGLERVAFFSPAE